MAMSTGETDNRSFLCYLRSGLSCSSLQTTIFTLSVGVLGVMIVAGVVRYYVSHSTLPTMSLYVLNEGENQFRTGESAAALHEFESAVLVSPHNTDYLLNLGVVYNSVGDRVKAIDTFQRLLRIKADHPDANYFLGLLYLQQNQPDTAIEYISRSIEVRPSGGTAAAYNDLGVAYGRKGDVANAIDSYQRALETDPDFAPAQKNLAALKARSQ